MKNKLSRKSRKEFKKIISDKNIEIQKLKLSK